MKITLNKNIKTPNKTYEKGSSAILKGIQRGSESGGHSVYVVQFTDGELVDVSSADVDFLKPAYKIEGS